MKKSVKLWLAIGAILVLSGVVLFFSALIIADFDFAQLGSVKMKTSSYEIHDFFHSIRIDTTTADISFRRNDEKFCKVVCYEKENLPHTVSVENEILSIGNATEKEWYDYIGWSAAPEIIVYLPSEAYDSLIVESSTGNIELSNFEFQTISLSVSTGDIEINSIRCAKDLRIDVSTGKVDLTDIYCWNLTTEGDTGRIQMRNVFADEAITVRRSTGDVRFDTCDAANFYVETDTGAVEGTLCSKKNFIVKTDTGKIDVPESTLGGICEITTDTGDIKIEILG